MFLLKTKTKKKNKGVPNGSRNKNTGNKWRVNVEFNGVTEDGKIVVSGYSVFKFTESKGVPLDFLLSTLSKDEYVIDWLEFILVSVKHKWKLKGTLIKIENSMIDVYGREYSTPIIKEMYKQCEPFMYDF